MKRDYFFLVNYNLKGDLIMVYLDFTEKNSDILAKSSWLKTAEDLAGILDNQLFQVNLDEQDNYDARKMAESREKVFNDFCAICALNEITFPKLEPELYEVYLPKAEYEEKDIELTQRRKQHVLGQLKGSRGSKARDCRALVKTLEMFPDDGGGGSYSGISANNILAVVNSNLVSLGFEPVRPNYVDRKMDFPKDNFGPSETSIILIVDDDKRGMIKTARAIAGWPQLKIEYFYYDSSNGWGANEDEEIEKTAKAIIERKAQIVLMDQGMPPMDGSDVILRIKEITGINSSIFVANTRGDADKIHGVGALKNCDKGANFEGIQQAIRMLE
ncbi:hypothetical protein CL633_00575 [bacterium]|nr:hypothetical protein [bacterium]|tara:strand:- start:26135 stop:27124 length:990 start_codon:yes stop_codon:yes gene_type:complete